MSTEYVKPRRGTDPQKGDDTGENLNEFAKVLYEECDADTPFQEIYETCKERGVLE